MGRWEPDAEGRFRAAAIDLFAEIGYEQTTVAAIAERAGLTARTFFRHFADKREVLFHGSERLQAGMVDAMAQAPTNARVKDLIAAALKAPVDFFSEERRAYSRRRHAVIVANAELQERELIKLAKLTGALAESLRARGVAEPDASLAAETGIAIFRVAFAQWVGSEEHRSYRAIVEDALVRLRAFTED